VRGKEEMWSDSKGLPRSLTIGGFPWEENWGCLKERKNMPKYLSLMGHRVRRTLPRLVVGLRLHTRHDSILGPAPFQKSFYARRSLPTEPL